MTFKNLIPLKFFILMASLLLTGCAQTERAGDITLASPSTAQIVVIPSANNARVNTDRSTENNTNKDSSYATDRTIVGTNLVSDYGGAVSPGVSNPRPEGGIRIPGATSSPIASPSPILSSGAVTSFTTSTETISSSNAANKTNSPDASSSELVQDSKIPARTITITRTKPDCSSKDCPSIKVKRLSFIGKDRFNNFLDQTLASMAEVDTSNNVAFRSLAEFATYFWKISKPGYQVVLEASVKRGDEELVVVQLDSYIFTGGAHGLSTTQYINWLPKTDKILSLESMLLPKKMPAFEQALKKQHAIWLKTNAEAIQNPVAYNKLWPFVPTDNAALLSEGLALTYDPYTIAPYSFGRPTIVIPFSELKGILRPEVLP